MTFEPYPPASAVGGDHAFFDTVAEMQSGVLANGDQCHTAGYSAVGDGGGADGYTYHSTGQSGETEDGGFVIFGTVGDDYFTANNQTAVNVLQFGVVDNVIHTAEIRLAMFAAIVAGIPLYFPPGNTYLTDDTLNPDGDLTVHAEGAVLRLNQVSGTMFRWDDGNPDHAITIKGGRFEVVGDSASILYKTEAGNTGAVTIHDAEFDGAVSGLAGAYCASTTIANGNIEILNSKFTNFQQAGIQINSSSIRECKIDGCTVENIVAISTGGMSGITVGTNSDDATIEGFVSVTNCFVANVTGTFSASPLHGILVVSYRANVSSNHIEGCYNSNAVPDDAGIYTKATHCTKQNNRLFNSGGGQGAIASKGQDRGLDLGPPSSNNAAYGYSTIVVNNDIEFDSNFLGIGPRTGILMGSEETCEGNRIEGAAVAIAAGGLVNGNIANNYVLNTEQAAVIFASAQNLTIRNNQCDGWLGEVLSGSPIRAVYVGQNGASGQNMENVVIERNQTFNTANTANSKYVVYLNPSTLEINNVQLLYNETMDIEIVNVYESAASGTFTNVHTESISDERPTGWKTTGHRRFITQTAAGKVGEVCVVAGRVGTWKDYGVVDP